MLNRIKAKAHRRLMAYYRNYPDHCPLSPRERARDFLDSALAVLRDIPSTRPVEVMYAAFYAAYRNAGGN